MAANPVELGLALLIAGVCLFVPVLLIMFLLSMTNSRRGK